MAAYKIQLNSTETTVKKLHLSYINHYMGLFDTDFAIYVNFNRTQNRKTEIPQCYCGARLLKENQLVVYIVFSLFVSVL